MMPPFDTALLRHPAIRHRPNVAGPRFKPDDRVTQITLTWLMSLVLGPAGQGQRT